LAAGRTLIAVMENFQDDQGRIHIPEALLPYMGGLKIIE
jgi:seryl-tRNA synthetase